MSIKDARIERLLEELSESQSTPEQVCADCPELLPEVRSLWMQLRRLDADLSHLFPEPGEPPTNDAELPHIQGYEIQEILGRGGMGIVFRAHHLRLNRHVALKMILAGPYANPEERKRFVQEAEAVASLQHPNIVQVYDAGEIDGRPYFTMELVEGGRLSQRVNGMPQPAREAAALVATIANAVDAAHQKGIIHRDLTPSNILLASDGTPKVTDFGLARRLEVDSGVTLTGLPIGTPSYMAPEQARGEKTIGTATDIYALGAVLYDLLTGRPPFRADTTTATLQQILTEHAVSPSRLNPRVPRDLETICMKCLSKEPARRYASAADLAEDLRRFERGEPIKARPVSTVERSVRWVRRHPSSAAALAAMMVLAITLAATGMWWYRQRLAAELDAKVELRQAEQYRQKADYANAAAALDRAKRRLAGIGAASLRATLDRELATVDLLRQLDEIRLDRVIVAGKTGIENALLNPPNDVARPVPPPAPVVPGARYEKVFRTAGIASGEDPAEVAARVRSSPARDSFVAALDDWAACASNPEQQSWVLSVLKNSDSDPWRNCVRDPSNWDDAAALKKLADEVLADEALVSQQPPQILVLLAARLRAAKQDARPLMTHVVLAHPTDFWANAEMGNATFEKDPHEAMGYFRAASIIRPRLAIVHDAIAFMYGEQGRWHEAIPYSEKAIELDPGGASYHNNYAWLLDEAGRPDEAIAAAREAIRLDAGYDFPHATLAYAYVHKHRYEEALQEARAFLRLARPHYVARAQSRLLELLLLMNRDSEARDAWRETLAANPPDHDTWFGFAELCLFLGDQDAYRRGRTALLERFGVSSDPITCERTAKACLLLGGEPAQLKAAAALADHAVAKQIPTDAAFPYALFAQGLAAYRLGCFDDAITIMNGKAASAAGPCPRLIIAMALYKKGETDQARKTLSTAVSTSDWSRKIIAGEREPYWVAQILRREAESLIQPQPRANASTSPARTAPSGGD
jgi:serine/threonine-protein kinase